MKVSSSKSLFFRFSFSYCVLLIQIALCSWPCTVRHLMRMQLNTTYTCVNNFTTTFDITHPHAMNGASRTSRSHLRCDGWGKRWLRELEGATNGASLVLFCMKNKSPAPSIARCIAIHRAMDCAGDLFFMHIKLSLHHSSLLRAAWAIACPIHRIFVGYVDVRLAPFISWGWVLSNIVANLMTHV